MFTDRMKRPCQLRGDPAFLDDHFSYCLVCHSEQEIRTIESEISELSISAEERLERINQDQKSIPGLSLALEKYKRYHCSQQSWLLRLHEIRPRIFPGSLQRHWLETNSELGFFSIGNYTGIGR